MRRILAISMAAAIPAVLPMNASDAREKPKPHYASAHGKTARTGHGIRDRAAHAADSRGRPENDVKVSTDDPGNEGQGTPEAASTPGAPGASGTVGAPGAPGATTGRTQHRGHVAPVRTPRKRTGSATQSRPSTGPDTGFSIPDDADMEGDMGGMTLPPEAAEVIKEIGTRTKPRNATPPRPAAPAKPAQPAAPAQAAPPQAAAQPAQATPARAQRNKNIKFTSANARVGDPSTGASRLTLRTNAGKTGRTVTLRCEPAGGTHPNAAQACNDVAKSNGDLKAMPAGTNPRACFMIYNPVTVTAQGDWHGQPVNFSHQYPNSCVMRDKTGSVFDF